ncbi:D-arabinono-1,4-lactone oxidase, partial [Kickxella alabastrina]
MDFSPSESALIDRLRCGPANFEFTNWAKTFRSRPRFFLSPETETEIIQLIHLANRHQLTIKPIGSGHSPSDLACTNSMMLDMSKMKRILSHDPYACTITVESGIRLHELHQVLKQRQMALSSVGAISDQSIAGAIATATHGTGMQFGDLSSMITHLVIIDGLGVRHQCSKAVEGDLFDAARCSLGALGVITQVTLQCEPMFTLHAVQVPDTLDRVLDDLPAVLQSAEHVRFWWFPHTDHTVVWRANRSSMAQRPDPGSFWRDQVYGFHYYQLQLFKARCSPGDIPRLTEEHFRNRFDRRT